MNILGYCAKMLVSLQGNMSSVSNLLFNAVHSDFSDQ